MHHGHHGLGGHHNGGHHNGGVGVGHRETSLNRSTSPVHDLGYHTLVARSPAPWSPTDLADLSLTPSPRSVAKKKQTKQTKQNQQVGSFDPTGGVV